MIVMARMMGAQQGRHQNLDRLTEQFVAVVAKHLFDRPVGESDRAAQIDNDDAEWADLDRAA